MALPTCRNLVFEGGGVKGIAYVGALKVLEERGVLPGIKRVGGASAGAINAALLALGYTRAELEEVLWDADFRSFLDSGWLGSDIARVLKRYGWYKGDAFQRWIEELVARKTGSRGTTFSGLAAARGARGLYLVGTNVNTGHPEIYSPEHTPDLPVARAVRASMSIPFFFAAAQWGGDVRIDGGVLINYPVKLFDRARFFDDPKAAVKVEEPPPYYQEENKRLKEKGSDADRYLFNRATLGFRLDSAQEVSAYRDHEAPPRTDISSLPEFTLQLARMVLDLQDRRHLHDDDWRRTVYIDTCGVQTTDFDITDAKKEELVASGEKHARDYFAWLDADERER